MSFNTLLFKDKNVQALFEKEGFVKIPLLSADKVDELVSFFEETRERHNTVSHLHHTTTDTGDSELIMAVDEKVKSLFVPALENILADFKPLIATYHIKEGGKGSETGIHQDPTFVDENKYCSANVWVALHDISADNGNLFFIQGSHTAVSSIRAIPVFPSYYESFRDKLPSIATQVPLKKGEAVIFSNGTIHGATENITNQTRLAATLLVCSKPADWLLYYNKQNEQNQLEKYHLDFDAFISMPKNGKPDPRTLVETVSYIFPQLSFDDFSKVVGINIASEKSYFERFANMFKKKTTV